MKPISEFKHSIKFLLTDIDDTLTDEGLLSSEAFDAIWKVHNHGIKVIPVTGRPAGWCEMIARMWPVAGVIGENGGFYFQYANKKMHRHYFVDENQRTQNTKKLIQIREEVLQSVPGCAIASDQFCREMDLAVDFCEDVKPLARDSVARIVDIFKKHGAQAKVSSIHVNGWFGTYNKVTSAIHFLKSEFNLSDDQIQDEVAFSGDSPNDEPMFEFLTHTFAVANISNFLNQLKFKPSFVANKKGGSGFTEIATQIILNQK